MQTTSLLIGPVLAALLVASFTGCGDGPVGRGKEPDTLIPTTIGNRWIGARTRYRKDGGIVSQRTDTIQIISDTLIAGTQWFSLGMLGQISNRVNGVWAWDRDTARLVYKYPALPGEPFMPYDDVTVTVLSTNTQTTVPLGSFRCYVYRIPLILRDSSYDVAARDTLYDYIAPGTGFVRRELLTTTSKHETYRSDVWELSDAIVR